MIQVSEEQVRDILPMDECVRIMRQTFTALRKGNELKNVVFVSADLLLRQGLGGPVQK